MIRKLAIGSAVLLASAGFMACNSSYEVVEETVSSAAVRAFSLAKNDSVMANLDSVFFSIDLIKGVIFNADSLPKGTDVTHLVPVISTIEGASSITMTVQRPGLSDTTYTYKTNTEDSIDFTHPVALNVVSPDGLTSMNYTIYVNVHQVEPDSLTWNLEEGTRLNTRFATIDAQRTVRGRDCLYTLVRSGQRYSMGVTRGIADMGSKLLEELPSSVAEVSFPFTPDIESLATFADELYILDTAGNLYRSSDSGATWTAAGRTWRSIIGDYDGRMMLGITAGATPAIEDALSAATWPLPQGMAVENFSAPVTYAFSMASAPQMLVTGGRTAAGALTGHTYGFDGTSWARVSKTALPVALESLTVVPYYTYGGQWSSLRDFKTLVAMGGRDARGAVNDTTYISTDYGYNWRKAEQHLQLPKQISGFYDAQAYVLSTTLDAPVIVPAIAKPIESWPCPYIYLFGGVGADGKTSDMMWRGTINRLTFKPIE